MKGPCSTSKKREVAVNFAKEDGIILKLNNDGVAADLQCFFDCSWISNYFEEDERLWMAVEMPQRIVSIVIVRSARDYSGILRALYMFDAMISGVNVHMGNIKEAESDYELISKLIESELNGGAVVSTEFDGYLKNEWDLFLQNKEKLRFDLSRMRRYFKRLSNLVAFSLREYKENEPVVGKDNVLKAEWMSIFPAVHTVEIESKFGHKFRLKELLESMKAMPASVGTVIATGGGWAQSALTDEVSTSFAEAGWTAEHEGFKIVLKAKEQ